MREQGPSGWAGSHLMGGCLSSDPILHGGHVLAQLLPCGGRQAQPRLGGFTKALGVKFLCKSSSSMAGSWNNLLIHRGCRISGEQVLCLGV